MAFEKESLGRMATFLLPINKLKTKNSSGQTIDDQIHGFLIANYSGYTLATGNIFGYWKDRSGKEFFGEHREYKVSFSGKERIPHLENFLSEIAKEINEECVYLETGEDSWLIYPEI